MSKPLPLSSHLIVTHQSLRALMGWAAEFVEKTTRSGRRVIWAPAHALGGAVSLRTWVLDRAAAALGDSAPEDTSLLLSGAADAIVIADPASADAASLEWLTDMLSCSEEVADLVPVPPLPQLVVLVPARGGAEGAASDFLAKLTALGSEEVRATGHGGFELLNFAGDVNAALGRNDKILAAMALSPVPLPQEDYNAVASAAGADARAVTTFVEGPLFQAAGGYITPAAAEVRAMLRESLEPADLFDAAALLLPVVEARYPGLPDARVELTMRSGRPG